MTAVRGRAARRRGWSSAGAAAEVLIPLARKSATLTWRAKRIVVTPPDGLLEVNGEWR